MRQPLLIFETGFRFSSFQTKHCHCEEGVLGRLTWQSLRYGGWRQKLGDNIMRSVLEIAPASIMLTNIGEIATSRALGLAPRNDKLSFVIKSTGTRFVLRQPHSVFQSYRSSNTRLLFFSLLGRIPSSTTFTSGVKPILDFTRSATFFAISAKSTDPFVST